MLRYGRLLPLLRASLLLAVLLAALLEVTALRASAAPTSTIIVTTTADDLLTGNGCSLREALANANANAQLYPDCAGGVGTDNISFHISPGGPQTITLTYNSGIVISGLSITDPVILDGTTQYGCTNYPCIEIDGENTLESAMTLTAGNSVIRGLVLNRNQGNDCALAIAYNGNDVIAGNYIGTDITGTTHLENTCGIVLGGQASNFTNVRIGGTSPADRNLISGNLHDGIDINPDAANILIQGNYIGTDSTGMNLLPNAGHGIELDSSNNTVGGTIGGSGNVISGNGLNGVYVYGGYKGGNETIQGNYIGTNAAGSAQLPNGGDGIALYSTKGNLIGGTGTGAPNLISGNDGNGISLDSSSNNTIQGNLVGTDASGVNAVGNLLDGILLASGHKNAIGGTSAAAGNLIAFNAKKGIVVGKNQNQLKSVGNALHRNRIFANGGPGIDLGNNGVTANDSGDADSGPNAFQNYPVIKSAAGATKTVAFKLNSAPNTTFTVELYANPACSTTGFGEGRRYLGAATVTTGATGMVSASTVTLAFAAGEVITATATDPHGNTSEFSRCHTAT